jgi:hypothetical protein
LQIDEVDVLDYLIKDEKTDIITMYLEGFKRGRAFFDLARKENVESYWLSAAEASLTPRNLSPPA